MPPVAATPSRQLSPTDVSQFIRLEQCQRYLRLRLHERAHGTRFLRDYGVLRLLIADMKSSTAARVEHRLQVAFYAEILERVLGQAQVPFAGVEISVLYRGPAELSAAATAEERARLEREQAAAQERFGV